MRNIKLYEETDDFVAAEGQGNYVMSIEPGVAYVRENQSVKYNSDYDLIVELGQKYTVDSSTSAFIEGLYANTVSSFKILVTENGNEYRVVDETCSRGSYEGRVFYSALNLQFVIYPNSPKTYGAFIPLD